MGARQIIRNGGFDPEDLAMLDGVFADCWKQIEGRYTVANGDERNAARESLATIIVALAKKHHDQTASELEAEAIAMFDRW